VTRSFNVILDHLSQYFLSVIKSEHIPLLQIRIGHLAVVLNEHLAIGLEPVSWVGDDSGPSLRLHWHLLTPICSVLNPYCAPGLPRPPEANFAPDTTPPRSGNLGAGWHGDIR
jgi:hypothetical protein